MMNTVVCITIMIVDLFIIAEMLSIYMCACCAVACDSVTSRSTVTICYISVHRKRKGQDTQNLNYVQ
jgi:hypothetical protein